MKAPARAWAIWFALLSAGLFQGKALAGVEKSTASGLTGRLDGGGACDRLWLNDDIRTITDRVKES